MRDLGNKEIMAQNLQRLMDSRGIDRNRLCADLGFKYTTLTDWLKANTYPRIDKIEMMANYFHVPKSELVEKKNKTEEQYYLDKEAAEFVEFLRTHPGARMLFSAAKDISKEEMEEAVRYIEFLKSKHK